MRFLAPRLVAVFSIVIGVCAQEGVSSQCQSATMNVTTGPASICLSTAKLSYIFTAPENQSVIPSVDDWLASMCIQTACTNDTIQHAFAGLMGGCLDLFGITQETAEDFDIRGWYPTARNITCLKDIQDNNDFCFIQTLRNIESSIGRPLTKTMLTHTLPTIQPGHSISSITCTPCNRAAYASARPRLNETSQDSWDRWLTKECGIDFIRGLSDTIKQSANNTPPGSGSAANGVLKSASDIWPALLSLAGIIAFSL